MAVSYTPRANQLKTLWAAAQFNPWVRGLTLASTAAYMGYEYLTNDSGSSDSLPVGSSSGALPTKSSTSAKVSLNPTIKSPVQDLINRSNENAKTVNQNFKNVSASIDSIVAAVSAQNAANHDAVSASPLLSNQVQVKDSLDAVFIAIQGLSSVVASFADIYTAYSDAHLNVSIIDAQNAKVLTDYQKQMAANSDYGRGDYFYDFIASADYWAKIDSAEALYYVKNNLGDVYIPLSEQFLVGEIELIEGMEGGDSTKSDIRKAVEDYRKSHVPVGIRALVGQTLVADIALQNDLLQSQNDLAKAQSISLSSSAIKEGDAAFPYGSQAVVATANALAGLTSILKPVSQWADSAKVEAAYRIDKVALVDVDGVPLTDSKGKAVPLVSPMELSVMKDGVIAREKTDIVTETFDDTDNPLGGFDLMPFLNFVGRADTFDKNKVLSNLFKPEGV